MPDRNRRHKSSGYIPAAISKTLLLSLSAVLLLLLSAGATATGNLIKHGSFDQPGKTSLKGWRAESRNHEEGTQFAWAKRTDGVGIAIVRSTATDDASWNQTVAVKADTWYRLSGWLRGIGIGHEGLGGNLSLKRGTVNAGSLRGEDSGWQQQTLYFRTGPNETHVTVACRLGGHGEPSTGEVQCTHFKLFEIFKPLPGSLHVYDPLKPRDSASGAYYAAEDHEQGRAAGIFAAIAMAALVLLGIRRYGRMPSTLPTREALSLAALLLLVLATKIIAAPFFSYAGDIRIYTAWAAQLAKLGPGGFYTQGLPADYPPAYMLVLWGVGALREWLDIPIGSQPLLILLKLPALLADAFIAILIFGRLRPDGMKLAWFATLGFALNPALIFDSAIWGQTDSILGLLSLLAFLAAGRREFELAWAFAALAILTKPQSLILVPILVLWPWGWWRTGRPISALFAAAVTTIVIAAPFAGGQPWSWLVDLYLGTTGHYAETSVNAMNLAAVLFGMRESDTRMILGLSAFHWTFVIGLTIGLGFLFAFLRLKDRVTHTQLIAATALVAFVCLARMHERYLYPFFVFAVLLGVTGRTGILYWILSALFLVNEAVVYLYQDTASAGPAWLWRSVGLLMTVGMLGWLALTWQTALGRTSPPASAALKTDDAAWLRWLTKTGTPSPTAAVRPTWTSAEITFIVSLTLIAGLLRLWHIGLPAEPVFDETYFVEQARNYLNGTDFIDPHPPFAKLMIALGIAVLGDEPFGWRIMNALTGTTLVALIYLLGRELFRRRLAAALGALFIAIDGFFLVESRIAVIDIHYLTWGVAAYLLTLRLVNDRAYHDTGRLLLIGAVLGISVGSKLYIPFFSFLLVLGVIAWMGWPEAKTQARPPLRFLMKPITVVGWTAFVVYLLTYTPEFLWGWWDSPADLARYLLYDIRSYEQAVAERANHPYASKWWSWPLMLQPIWYYRQDSALSPDMIVGIWGGGNPIVWWTTIAGLLLAGAAAWRTKGFVPIFLLAGWTIHILPWIWIGRTLFLYHYLPSLIFAMLALAWMIDRFAAGNGSRGERAALSAALPLVLVPFALTMDSAVQAIAGLAVLLIILQTSNRWLRIDPTFIGRGITGLFIAAMIGCFWMLLPIWIGMPIEQGVLDSLAWLTK